MLSPTQATFTAAGAGEEVASQEEVYLETTEEELRADLISEPATAKHWRMNREKLESDWERKISDDECK